MDRRVTSGRGRGRKLPQRDTEHGSRGSVSSIMSSSLPPPREKMDTQTAREVADVIKNHPSVMSLIGTSSQRNDGLPRRTSYDSTEAQDQVEPVEPEDTNKRKRRVTTPKTAKKPKAAASRTPPRRKQSTGPTTPATTTRRATKPKVVLPATLTTRTLYIRYNRAQENYLCRLEQDIEANKEMMAGLQESVEQIKSVLEYFMGALREEKEDTDHPTTSSKATDDQDDSDDDFAEQDDDFSN